jgi:multiple sugar transport system substrate-binding protein
MHRYRQLLLSFCLIVLFTVGVSGQPVTVDVLVRGTVDHFNFYVQRLAAFEQQHPNIKVNLINQESKGYVEKVAVMYAAGTLPDVVWVNPGQDFPRFGSSGIFLDLEPVARADNYNLRQFYPFLIEEAGRVGNKLYALAGAYHPGTAGLFYNTEMFDQAGLAHPDDSWTYERMTQIARRLTVDQDGDGSPERFGSAAIFSRTGAYLGVLQSYGGGFLAPDGRTQIIDTPETVAGFELLRAMSIDVHCSPRRGELSGSDRDHFLTEKAAMFISGYWEKMNIEAAQKGFSWSVAPIPLGPAGRVAGQANFDGWAISSRSKNVQAAWTVLKWLVSDEVLHGLVEVGFNTVARHNVNIRPEFIRDPVHRVFVQALAANAFKFPPIPHNFRYQEMNKLIDSQVRNPVWKGDLAVKQAVDQARPQLEALLATEPKMP